MENDSGFVELTSGVLFFLVLSHLTAIVKSIYKMTGQMVKLPEDEDTPEKVRSLLVEPMRAAEVGSMD